MTCLNPKYAYYEYVNVINAKGKKEVQKQLKFLRPTKANFWDNFDKKINDENQQYITIPCGKCKGCLIDKANEWATRAYIETTNWQKNSFLTLTYDDKHLPKNGTLIKKDIQDFMKRLRKTQKEPIRYICAGEYGDHSGRAHYHILAFNFWPEDCTFYKKGRDEKDTLWISRKLEKIWGKGLCVVGHVTYESTAYVCRYTMKKIFRPKEFWIKHGREPEFILTSRKGGIGINGITKKEKWEEIQRNNGIFIKTKKGVQLKKIPQFLKNKWREQNRVDYFINGEKNAREIKIETRAKLAKTDKNYWAVQKDTKEKIEKSIKKLDKRA